VQFQLLANPRKVEALLVEHKADDLTCIPERTPTNNAEARAAGVPTKDTLRDGARRPSSNFYS
jgi:hypothetical protein